VAISRKNNIIVASANADSFTLNGVIESVIVTPGSTTSTCSFSIDGVTVFDAGTMGANTVAQSFHDLDIPLQTDTIVVSLSGTGASVRFYVE
jgi:hypothetical protein